ncbi:MAG: hypothetical protein Q4F40_04540 [Akkermansia sp.]|nr:hypothetical protein [Akkermansia sp.]
MKKTVVLLLAAALGLSSCAWDSSYASVSSNKIGVTQQVLPATVISAYEVKGETSSSAKNVGTVAGGVLGAGLGQMLGGGSGRIVSAAGFGVAGALAGRALTDSMGNTRCQRVTVKVDGKNGPTYSFVQPIYKEFGPLSPGMHGNYHHGSDAHFTPDGY